MDYKGLQFSLIKPKNPDNGPIKKTGCGMVAYNRSLVLFGGRGDASTQLQPQPESSYQCGFTNELHLFDIREGE